MPDSPEIRQELEEERRQLKAAVSELRDELDEKAQQGKKLAMIAGAATAAVVATKMALKLTRRRRR
jgi:hypothetical protein